MAVEKVYLISDNIYGNHTHGYRKVVQIGADSDIDYLSPSRVSLIDGSEVHIGEQPAVRAIGITISTSPTDIPN